MNTVFITCSPITKIIPRHSAGLYWPVLSLVAALSVNIAVYPANAGAAQPAVFESVEPQASYIDEEEEQAYRAAKNEPDAKKRADKLIEFLHKYPNTRLMEQSDYDEIKTLEDEYRTYYAAKQEPDFEKKAEMLTDFLLGNPQSALTENINSEYRLMLRELSQGKKYELLESLGEKWLKTHPKDMDVYAFVAEATMNLQKHERCAECLESIYEMQPSPTLAKEIYTAYQKSQNLAKETEWAEKLFKMPEFNDDYMLRYDFVMKYASSGNLPKAAEYAELTLKSLDMVARPDAKTQEQLNKLRRACYHVIASNLMEKGNYTEAISAFKRAIRAEKYAEGYYLIGLCLDNKKQVDDAISYYAIAEMMGGEDAARAKARLEVLYRAMHNNTLIGIDKVYKKAKELLAEPAGKS